MDTGLGTVVGSGVGTIVGSGLGTGVGTTMVSNVHNLTNLYHGGCGIPRWMCKRKEQSFALQSRPVFSE